LTWIKVHRSPPIVFILFAVNGMLSYMTEIQLKL
jgi:hypothetical protein